MLVAREIGEGKHRDHERAARAGAALPRVLPQRASAPQRGEREDAAEGHLGQPAGAERLADAGESEGRRVLARREVLAHVAQLAREVLRRGVALLRLLRETTALDDPAQGGRDLRVERRDRRRSVVDDRRERLGGRLAVEGLLAGRELVEDRAERELVAAVVDRAAARLLRRHVTHRPEHGAGGRLRRRRVGPGGRAGVEPLLPLARAVGDELGEAEVEQLHEAVGRDHDVLGLEVAVHDPGGVRLREPVRHLGADVEDAAGCERVALGHQLAQRLAVDELHHDVGQPGRLPDVVDRHDVRVAERGRRARLLREAPEAQRVGGEPLGQELDRHVAVQLLVVGPPDLAHAAGPDAGGQLVSAELHSD